MATGNLSHYRLLPGHDQVGMSLHVAALAALAGNVRRATR